MLSTLSSVYIGHEEVSKALHTTIPLEIIHSSHANNILIGLYTDDSPGLKVDPVIVLVLSLVFIFSVVALHSEYLPLKLDLSL